VKENNFNCFIKPERGRKVLIFIRHGETTWKTKRITQGQLDSPLTEKGKRQAVDYTQRIHGMNIEDIISSPLGRAIETAEIISKIIGITHIIQAPEFKERNEGVFQGLTNKEQKERFPELFDKNGKIIDEDTIPSAEPMELFLNRIKKGIDTYQSDTIKIVVSHTGVLNGIRILQNKMEKSDFGNTPVGYLESVICE
jgi:broad specificity phosphatase PhoE